MEGMLMRHYFCPVWQSKFLSAHEGLGTQKPSPLKCKIHRQYQHRVHVPFSPGSPPLKKYGSSIFRSVWVGQDAYLSIICYSPAKSWEQGTSGRHWFNKPWHTQTMAWFVAVYGVRRIYRCWQEKNSNACAY